MIVMHFFNRSGYYYASTLYIQYYLYCDYVSLFLKLLLLVSILVLPAINMPPPRRSQSPAPLRRRLRERSATVGHRFRRQRHDAQRAADNDVQVLKRKIGDAQLKLDRANDENVFLKKTIASKDTKNNHEHNNNIKNYKTKEIYK